MSDEKIRNLGIVLITYSVLSKCCAYLKTESSLFQQRNKQLLGNLLASVDHIIAKSQSLSNIREAQKYLNHEINKEDTLHEIETQGEAMGLLYDILVQSTPTQIYDLVTFLEAYKKDGVLYTKKEMELVKDGKKSDNES